MKNEIFVNTHWKTVIENDGVPVGTIGLGRGLTEGGKVELYFGLSDKPEYREYATSEIKPVPLPDLPGWKENARMYINQFEDKIICPWCSKEVTKQHIKDEETFVNGGEQTGGILELWHKNCADRCEELERENGIRM